CGEEGSSLGNATLEPAVIATRCGANCSSFCAIDACIGAGLVDGRSLKKITTFFSSDCGFGRGPTARRSYALADEGAFAASDSLTRPVTRPGACPPSRPKAASARSRLSSGG